MNQAISEKRILLPSKHARILVIDANTDHWELIQKTMAVHFSHIKPIRASTGSEAMAYLTDCLAMGQGLPWLIIMEIDLPKRETGWQLIEQIRDLPAPAGYLPLIVLSHSDQAGDITESYHRGATSYIVKPRNQKEHLECIEALIDYWWNTAVLPDLRY